MAINIAPKSPATDLNKLMKDHFSLKHYYFSTQLYFPSHFLTIALPGSLLCFHPDQREKSSDARGF